MNILQINAIGQTLSTGRTTKEIATYINNTTRHTCFNIFSAGETDKNNIKIGSKVDVKLHAFFSRLTGKQAYFSTCATKKIIKFIKEKNIDIVILRNLHGNFINLPLLLKFLAKNDIATVVVLHDCWFYTGKCCHYTLDKCYRWQTGCGNCPRLKKDIPSWFFDRTNKMWNDKKNLFSAIPRLAVIGVSDWITNEAKKSFFNNAKIIRRIYNWIDLEVFKPQNNSVEFKKKLQLENKKVVLGVASGWSESKGLSSFIKLADTLNDDYQVVIVGGLPEGFKLPSNILHLPRTNSVKELAEIYSMADVFVTFSLEESFGKVSAEALACGTPVVCYNSTANKELVGEGCGRVLEPNDFTGVMQAVIDLCSLGKEQFSETCRKFAETNFDKNARIRDYLEVFESLLS